MKQHPSWRVLFPVGFGTALSLIGDASMYTVLPTHTAVVGVTLASVGILLSINRWVRLGANGVAGWLSDRASKRIVFIAALFLGALSTAVYGFNLGFWPLFMGRLLWGIAWAGIWVAGNGLVLDAAPKKERGKWVGNYHVSFFLGGGMGALIGGVLTDWLGYHSAMFVAAAISFIGAIVALLFVPHVEQNNEVEIIDSYGISEPTRWRELIAATAVLGINRLVIAGIFYATISIYLLEVVGESVEINAHVVGIATVAGVVVGLRTLLSMILTPLIGWVSDKYENRWHIVANGILPGIVGFILLAINVPYALLFGLPLTSITASSNQSMSTALIGDLGSGRRNGRFLGVLYTVGDLGSAIGPMVAFFLLPDWGMTSLYWVSVLLFSLLLLVAVYSLKVSKKSRRMSLKNS